MPNDQPPNPEEAQRPGDTLFLQPPHLLINWPDGSTQQFNLTTDVTRIGRSPNNQIVVPVVFDTISRTHLEIRRQGDGFLAIDLGSSNGVRINDTLIAEDTPLNDSDEIRIGLAQHGQEVRLRFKAGAEVLLKRTQPVLTGSLSSSSAVLDQPPAGAHLHARWPNGREGFLALDKDMTILGRGPEADVRFPANLLYISSKHAEIRRTDAGLVLIDLKSTNGTWLNGQLLKPNTPTPLHDGARIRIGDEELGASIGVTFYNPDEQLLPMRGYSPASAAEAQPLDRETIVIGRAPDCDLVLASPTVSRQHARVSRHGNQFEIEDLHSTNGTRLNGQRITRAALNPGDLIQIEQHLLMFQHNQLVPFDSYGVRLDAIDLSQQVHTRRGDLQILDDISLTVLPREFVALVGGSGAGKSTLMDALIGLRPAKGQVLFNGRDLYQDIESIRPQLGYVPQADTLPPDVSAEERGRRIDQVLETVGMNTPTIRRTLVGRLSGGQRKRVSIASELLADPKIFFLDEPTSGLDPGLEKKMMHTLRRMADEGRTVVLITHATANIVQVDHVAFLAEGELIYFGPPHEALSYFGVDEFADIYERIELHGQSWRRTFVDGKAGLFQRFITARQSSRQAIPIGSAVKRSGLQLAEIIRQFFVLTRRALSVLTSDYVTLLLLLLLFPVTAVLQLLIATPHVLVGDPAIMADPVAAAATLVKSYVPIPDTNTFVFVMGLEAVLVGMYVPSNELIKERSIYLRERLVNLRVPAYLLSKVAIFIMFAAVQCVLYLLILSRGVELPAQGLLLPGPIELFITLFLTMCAGIGLGLLVSAVARSSDMAIYVLVMLMFFEFFFSGTVFDLRGKAVESLSYFTATRWALTSLGVTIDMPRLAESTIVCNTLPPDPRNPQAAPVTQCQNYKDAVNDLLLPYDHDKLIQSWAILVGMAVLTMGLAGVFIKRLDRT
jgi:ABC-type multidrug transport system ATPase subunit/pSer/pThr/pTyr-binding forkhead associated (FHA) protein